MTCLSNPDRMVYDICVMLSLSCRCTQEHIFREVREKPDKCCDLDGTKMADRCHEEGHGGAEVKS